ncbi:MAG: mismatch-specific DNA-glycosylase [Dehalococcoidia bacterium]
MAMLRPLPDHLAPGLDVVFVGANPGVISSQQGHYYANPRNPFWTLLHKSGVVPEPLAPKEDARVVEFGIGLTDLVKRPTAGIEDLSREEMRAGATRLEKKLQLVQPLVICFNGKQVYQGFTGHGCELGVQQDESIAGARVFVMPSTSPQNTSWSERRKLNFFRKLKRLIDEERHARA